MTNAEKKVVREFVARIHSDVCSCGKVRIANNGRVTYFADTWQGKKVKSEWRLAGFFAQLLHMAKA